MRTTKVFRTDRFIVTMVRMVEVNDVFVTDEDVSHPGTPPGFIVSGKLNFRMFTLPNPNYVRTQPDGFSAPWVSRPNIGVRATSFAVEPDTVYVCSMANDKAFLQSIHQYEGILDFITSGSGPPEEKLNVLHHVRWNAAQDTHEDHTAEFMEQHAAAVVFVDTGAYRDLFGGRP